MEIFYGGILIFMNFERGWFEFFNSKFVIAFEVAGFFVWYETVGSS